MAKLERSSMLWYCPDDAAGHARKLKANGCEQVWIKGGVDNPGLRTVWAQWSGPQAQAYADNGVEPLYWAYIYPESPEVQWDTIKRALVARPSRIICLNAEVEWDDYTEAFVQDWVRGLRRTLAGIHDGAIGFSSVPSWDKGVGGLGSPYHAFPYEAFCHACDFSMPQAYFLNPDQIVFENRRNDTNKPVIPTLWAVGDPSADPPGFTDAQLVEYARQCVATCENFAGFSSWRGELDTYQYDAMRRAYDLMPEVEIAVSSPAEVIGGALQRADGFMDPIKVEFYDLAEPGAGIPYYAAVKVYNPDTKLHYQKEWIEGVYQPWALLDAPDAPPVPPAPVPQPVPPVAPPPAPTPDPIPPTQEAAMSWFKLHGGNLDADSNAYDRYQGAEGRATVFRKGRQLFGFIQPWDGPERAWGPIDVPPEGNVQQVRIFPEGTWTVFALVDPMDGKRAEYGISVAPL